MFPILFNQQVFFDPSSSHLLLTSKLVALSPYSNISQFPTLHPNKKTGPASYDAGTGFKERHFIIGALMLSFASFHSG